MKIFQLYNYYNTEIFLIEFLQYLCVTYKNIPTDKNIFRKYHFNCNPFHIVIKFPFTITTNLAPLFLKPSKSIHHKSHANRPVQRRHTVVDPQSLIRLMLARSEKVRQTRRYLLRPLYICVYNTRIFLSPRGTPSYTQVTLSLEHLKLHAQCSQGACARAFIISCAQIICGIQSVASRLPRVL